MINEAVARTKRLLNLGDDYQVLFLQGGASMQFCMIPMNLALPGKPVDYINTGTWATKAIKEAKILGLDVRVIASSEDKNFSYIPKEYTVDPEAAYLHFTSNNTIKGTQWAEFPKAGKVPLVSDMSSDFMSRPFDPQPFRADLRRRPEKYRPGRDRPGHHPQGYAGPGTGQPFPPC